jgi:cbb3-type cytochrome oxidase subunit 3
MFADYWPFVVVPLIFVAIVVWIYRPSAKRRYKADGNIPFEGDKHEGKARQRGQ